MNQLNYELCFDILIRNFGGKILPMNYLFPKDVHSKVLRAFEEDILKLN